MNIKYLASLISSVILSLLAGHQSCMASKDSGISVQAHIYNKAEQWFSDFENTNNYTPISPDSQARDGFFQRCYHVKNDKSCYGVTIGMVDGFLWKQLNDGKWMIEMRLPEMQDKPAVVLGRLQGNLSNDLMEYYDDAGASRQKYIKAIILGNGALKKGHYGSIRRAFAAHKPIILENATANKIARLQKTLKITGYDRLPDSIHMLDVFGVRMDEDGDIKYIKALKPLKLPNSIITETKYSASGSESSHHEEVQYTEDSEVLQAIRTASLIRWIYKEDADNNEPSLHNQSLAMNDSNPFASLDATVRSTEGRMVFQFKKNTHTLTTNVWGVHQMATDEDWF